MSEKRIIEVPELNEQGFIDTFKRMAFLESSFGKVFLQRKRIEEDRELFPPYLPTLFADIHFFLIASSDVMKMLKAIRGHLQQNIRIVEIYKKYILKLEHLDKFRDHLEHISDGRLDGYGKKRQPLTDPDMLGNLINDAYTFGGESFCLKEAFLLFDNLFSEIQAWNQEERHCVYFFKVPTDP